AQLLYLNRTDVALIVLGLDFALTALLINRMRHVHEEMSEYRSFPQLDARERYWRRDESETGIRSLLWFGRDTRLDRLQARMDGSFISQVRQFEAGLAQTQQSFLVTTILMATILCVGSLLFNGLLLAKSIESTVMVFTWFPIWTVFFRLQAKR